jgi:RimJ/RimL family protein N-acetyltransferase
MCSIETTPAIATERLRLRGLRVGDAERMAALANDPGVVRMTSSMPWPYDIAEARSFIERCAEHDSDRTRTFAIDHPGVGYIGTLGFSPSADGSELGYWLGREYWGQGFATEAATAALAWAKDVWKKRFIAARHYADNPRSGEVLVKAGFLYTGVVKRLYSTARGEDAPARMMVWLA